MSGWLWSPSIGSAPGTPGEYLYIATGGMVLGGSAVVRRGRVYTPSGDLVIGGDFFTEAATLPQERYYVMTGGLELGGAFGVDGRVWADVQTPETEWTDEVGFE